MQVIFGGIGVVVAIVAAVIAYFAWVQPHSPAPETGGVVAPRDSATPATVHGGDQVPLTTLQPSLGAVNVRRSGADLALGCATGENDDRQRAVEYDLLARYTALSAQLRVSKARDADTPMQVKVFLDGREAAFRTLKRSTTDMLSVPLDGAAKLRIQLTCQFADGELTLGTPRLTHTP